MNQKSSDLRRSRCQTVCHTFLDLLDQQDRDGGYLRLAQAAGLGLSTVRNVLSGAYWPTVATRAALAEALGLSTADFDAVWHRAAEEHERRKQRRAQKEG